jgi:hemerythrin
MYFEWSEEISLNVPEIDGQHKLIIGIINDLHDSIQIGVEKEDVEKILVRLILYIQTHFDSEAKLMVGTGYPDIAAHKKEHFALIEKVEELYSKLIKNEPALAFEIMRFLKKWLTEHFMITDKKLGTYLSSSKKLT